MDVPGRPDWRLRAAAVVDVARAAASEGPPPAGLPFFGLDHRSPTRPGLVEDLATRGIFRKYERVLDLGSGLGATARYLVRRLGCTAIATATSRDEALSGRLLTARAALDWQVAHVATDAAALPFARAAFTHVWILEALPGLGPTARVLAEAFRVLRPGGHLGVQELVLHEPDDALAARGFVAARTREDELAAAGFVELATRDVGAVAVDDAARLPTAWTRLAQRLGPTDPMIAERERLVVALASGRLGVAQLTARRP